MSKFQGNCFRDSETVPDPSQFACDEERSMRKIKIATLVQFLSDSGSSTEMEFPPLIPFPQHTTYATNRANILPQSRNEEDEDSPFQINVAIPNYSSSNRANKKIVVLESTSGTESDEDMQEKIAHNKNNQSLPPIIDENRALSHNKAVTYNRITLHCM